VQRLGASQALFRVRQRGFGHGDRRLRLGDLLGTRTGQKLVERHLLDVQVHACLRDRRLLRGLL